jgi:hypothetical protein
MNVFLSAVIVLVLTFTQHTMTTPMQMQSSAEHAYANISRVVVIADIHSDLVRFKTILQNAKIIDSNGNWIAEKNTLLVQLGDQIDRKHIDADDISNKHHFRLTRYTDSLQKLALQKNSDFISLVGNHELMNIGKIKNKLDVRYIISQRPVVAIVGNYLFCHGGFHLEHYKLLQSFHKNIRDLNEIWYKYVYDINLTSDETFLLNALILDTENSILYTRKTADKNDNNNLFRHLDLEYMFVGHSETENIFLKNKVWHLDQVLRPAFDERIYTYIDIIDGNITINSLQY